MTIYEASTSREVATLVAKRADWQEVLATIPERPRGEDRPQLERIRAAVTVALAGDGEVVRVTLGPDDARWVLARG